MTFWGFASEHPVALCVALFIIGMWIHDCIVAYRSGR